MSANKAFLERLRKTQRQWEESGKSPLPFLVAALGLILGWIALMKWKDGRDRKPTPDKKQPEQLGQEGRLNEDRSDSKPPEPGELEGDVPPAQEASFLNIRTLIIATAGLVGMIVFVLVLAGVIFGYFSFLNPFGVAAPPAQPGGNAPPATVIPPAPTLQVDYFTDLQRVQTTQEANINHYGWMNQEAGVVRLPIERAMELIAQQGLPVTSATPASVRGEAPDNSGFGFATPEP